MHGLKLNGEKFLKNILKRGYKVECEKTLVYIFDKYSNNKNIYQERFRKYLYEFIENEIPAVEWEQKIIYFFIEGNLFVHKLENYIYRFGKNGKVKWEEYQKSRLKTFEKKHSDGYQFNNGRNLKEYIKRHGEADGYKLWLERNLKQKFRFSKEWYIKTYGKEKGIEKHEEYKKSMNKASLKSFIKKYGQDDGTKRFGEFSKKLSFRNTIEYYNQKYGLENGGQKYREYWEKVMLGVKNAFKKGYSKVSQKLFWEIYENLDEKKKQYSKFGELNGEQFFSTYEGKVNKRKFIAVDYKCGNVIIEFQGTYWHSFEDKKQKDLQKKEWLESHNYDLLYVEENGYYNSKEVIILNCIKFINEKFKY